MSDEDEVESEGESSSESDSDSEELMGSAETSDFPKDTELALDNLGMLALEGETSSGGVIEKAVDVLQGPNTVDLAISVVSQPLTTERIHATGGSRCDSF